MKLFLAAGLLIFLIILSLLLAFGIGTGYLLTLLIDGLSFADAILIGVVAVSFSVFIMVQMIQSTNPKDFEESTGDQEDKAAESQPKYEFPDNWPRRRRRKSSAWK